MTIKSIEFKENDGRVIATVRHTVCKHGNDSPDPVWIYEYAGVLYFGWDSYENALEALMIQLNKIPIY
jgi:hypothetical protein